jgi:hypothetical protein
MAKLKPDDPNANFGVGVVKYFKDRIEAESEFQKMTDVWTDVGVEFWEKRSNGAWEVTESR